MGKNLYEAKDRIRIKNEDAKRKYGTKGNTFSDFPQGTRVEVICLFQDFRFFHRETGIVTHNSGIYLGIDVKLDNSECDLWNFNPEDLRAISCKKKRFLSRRKKIEHSP
jgi:hypothetical protein